MFTLPRNSERFALNSLLLPAANIPLRSFVGKGDALQVQSMPCLARLGFGSFAALFQKSAAHFATLANRADTPQRALLTEGEAAEKCHAFHLERGYPC